MGRNVRIGLVAVGAVVLLLALGFFIQVRWATALWPVPAGPLSHIFVASILAAIGAPAIWIALADEGRALAAGAADLAVTNAGVALTGAWFFFTTGNVGMLLLGIATALLCVLCVGIFRGWHGVPFRDARPTPTAVRIAFAVFALLLAITAAALIAVRPNTFPWPLGPENSVIYGFIFLGAMAYFLYGLAWPVWGNACDQLVGFLAYDIVLIVPFLRQFAAVKPEMRTSLTVYTAVVALSGLLALYFLLLHPATRFTARPAAPRPRLP